MAAATRERLGPLMTAFLVIDFIIVLISFGVRTKLATFGYDDFVIVLAMIGFVLMCTFCFVSFSYGFGFTDSARIAALPNYNATEGVRYLTIAQITYVASFPVVRISVALVLHRIVQGMPHIQRLLMAFMVFVGIYALGCLLVDVLQCIPLKAVWGDGTGKCLSFQQLAGLGFAVSALDIASALFYVVLPVFLLKGLQMGRRTKIAIIFLLGLGGVTVIISVIRLGSLVLIVNVTDLSQALDLHLESFIYSILEFGISILTTSLVAFRPLVKYLPFGSHGRSSAGQKASGPAGVSGLSNSGPNHFELCQRHHGVSNDTIRLSSDDADSQRDILRNSHGNRIWKTSHTSVLHERRIDG